MSSPFIAAALGIIVFAVQRDPAPDKPAPGAPSPGRQDATGEANAPELPLVSWALNALGDDEGALRVDPKAVARSALQAIEKRFSAVVVHGDADSNPVTITVGTAIKSLDMRAVRNVGDLSIMLRHAIAFAQRETGRTQMEMELAALSGILPFVARQGSTVEPDRLGGGLEGALLAEAERVGSRKERIESVQRLFDDVASLVRRDTYRAYVEAAGKCEEIVRLDEQPFAGHAWLAYVDVIRAHEHGDPLGAEALEQVRKARSLLPQIRSEAAKMAQRMIDDGHPDHAKLTIAASAAAERSPRLVAAEAYLKLLGGDVAGAKSLLETTLRGAPARHTEFLLGVLGAIHLHEGDLDAARDVLARARNANSASVRIAWLLAETSRRRGKGHETEAMDLYDNALRLDADHVGSMLGKALVWLDRGQGDEAERAAQAALEPRRGASKRQQDLARSIKARALAARERKVRARP